MIKPKTQKYLFLSWNSIPQIKTYPIDMRSLEYEKSGKLKGTVEATGMQYYSGGKLFKLVDPRYYFLDDNVEGWSVTSYKGHFLDKNDMLFLQGNVILTNHKNGNRLNPKNAAKPSRQYNFIEYFGHYLPGTRHYFDPRHGRGFQQGTNQHETKRGEHLCSCFALASPSWQY